MCANIGAGDLYYGDLEEDGQPRDDLFGDVPYGTALAGSNVGQRIDLLFGTKLRTRGWPYGFHPTATGDSPGEWGSVAQDSEPGSDQEGEELPW